MPSPVAVHLATAATTPSVVARYRSFVRTAGSADCWLWLGAISGRGHGRFWLGEGRVVIAHRFAFALAHVGAGSLELPPVVAHRCDNPLCQNPSHLRASSAALNRAEWVARRETIGGPLRDRRGAAGRARAVRDAAKAGASVVDATSAGLRDVDRDQGTLW